jgi:23S rRNA (cytidine1920-2'-O)/16S rRNA (cytidine1409-2'-O)-methyltransferase
MKKERADKVLVERGLAETRQKAQALIMAGVVSGPNGRIEKAGQPVDPGFLLTVAKSLPFVGRGGLKLEQALDEFAVSPAGLVCADIGSSTGGFTDCLLQRGAALVYAVDVDIRQLDDKIRRDPRVVAIQKNARNLVPADFAAGPDKPVGGRPTGLPSLAVMDVSFISILKILPALRAVLTPVVPSPARGPLKEEAVGIAAGLSAYRYDGKDDGPRNDVPSSILLTLIKPQFEAGRGQVGKKGIVRDAALHAEILARVAEEAQQTGFALRGLVRCTARGRTGNQEFFARWEPGGIAPGPNDVLEWIRKVASTTHETD